MAGSVGQDVLRRLALRMIEQGRLNLNAPISTYLGTKPWFSRLPNAKDITVAC
jgi:CubicO group peptidase (beta-lactamase class C family)